MKSLLLTLLLSLPPLSSFASEDLAYERVDIAYCGAIVIEENTIRNMDTREIIFSGIVLVQKQGANYYTEILNKTTSNNSNTIEAYEIENWEGKKTLNYLNDGQYQLVMQFALGQGVFGNAITIDCEKPKTSWK